MLLDAGCVLGDVGAGGGVLRHTSWLGLVNGSSNHINEMWVSLSASISRDNGGTSWRRAVLIASQPLPPPRPRGVPARGAAGGRKNMQFWVIPVKSRALGCRCHIMDLVSAFEGSQVTVKSSASAFIAGNVFFFGGGGIKWRSSHYYHSSSYHLNGNGPFEMGPLA